MYAGNPGNAPEWYVNVHFVKANGNGSPVDALVNGEAVRAGAFEVVAARRLGKE